MTTPTWPGPSTRVGSCEACGQEVRDYEQLVDARAVPDLALPVLEDFPNAWLCPACCNDSEKHVRAVARLIDRGVGGADAPRLWA